LFYTYVLTLSCLPGIWVRTSPALCHPRCEWSARISGERRGPGMRPTMATTPPPSHTPSRPPRTTPICSSWTRCRACC